jgi:hypothetical protein
MQNIDIIIIGVTFVLLIFICGIWYNIEKQFGRLSSKWSSK